jgi:hypothetical protein
MRCGRAFGAWGAETAIVTRASAYGALFSVLVARAWYERVFEAIRHPRSSRS